MNIASATQPSRERLTRAGLSADRRNDPKALKGLWRARLRVADDRLSQIASAVVAEIAAVADLGPELLGRVNSVACCAQCHRMVRTHREEQVVEVI